MIHILKNSVALAKKYFSNTPKQRIYYFISTLAFGGNPDQITLAGQDAGGVLSLTSLMINQDLSIKSVILQSAGLQHPWSYIESREAFRRTLNLADLVGKNFKIFFATKSKN